MEFVATVDHDTLFGLGFVPIEADYWHTTRMPIERVRTLLTCTPFDYPAHLYIMSLPDYFVRESEVHSYMGDFGIVTDIEEVDELYQLLIFVLSSETTDCGVDVEPTGPEPVSSFDLFGMSAIEILMEDVAVSDDLFEDTFNSIEGASDFVDLPLSFDILSGFISRPDNVYDSTSMDLSIFEYLPVSCDNKESFDHDPDPIDERVSPAIGDVETIDFGTEDQPRELKISSFLFTDERNRLIHLLRSYLDVFAWSYEDIPSLDPSINGKVRVCVDFRDINKASPKDDFPLPHIDLLVDNTTDHSIMSFMDGFSGAATTLFHDMMHRHVEVYVDDMIMKSQGRRIRKFRLRLNSKKCTFGVTSGKLLGHMVNRLQYISHFMVRMTNICEPIFRFLRKNQPTIWNDDYQIAFEKIKEYLLSPSVLVPPTSGHPLLLYLSILDMTLGCMLARLDDSGKKRVIYYLSKRILEYEMRYVMIERLCLALVWVARKLRHYMIEYSYVSQKSIKGSIVADHLASLSISEANHSGFGIGVLLISPQGDHIPRSFADALATLASSVDFSTNVNAIAKDRRALRQLATRFVICGETLYRRSADGMLLLCLDRASTDRVMRDVHARVCGPHMGGHMLTYKIMRIGYFWMTIEIDCCQFV
ncbi:hypothetical protein AAG906_016911 [Vitis piasezkii]